MLSCAAARTVKERLAVTLCWGAPESTTLKVSGTLDALADGDPASMPAALKVRPAGRVPAVSDQTYGAVPPRAAKVAS